MNVKIKTHVPESVLAALKCTIRKYTDIVSVFHCIQVYPWCWVGVAGNGGDGCYEYFLMYDDGQFECSDLGYGDDVIALRDVLAKVTEGI